MDYNYTKTYIHIGFFVGIITFYDFIQRNHGRRLIGDLLFTKPKKHIIKTRMDDMKKLIESVEVIIVRAYVLDSSGFIKTIFEHLEKVIKIRGITIIRALKGFGETGEHYVSLMDGIWELPIVIEFFDSEEKVKSALEYLEQFIKKEHIVYWKAYSNA